jgi:hypothetical protein
MSAHGAGGKVVHKNRETLSTAAKPLMKAITVIKAEAFVVAVY